MPTVTLTVDLPEEIAEQVAALPQEAQSEIAAAALEKAIVAAKPLQSGEKNYFAERAPQNSLAALFAEWAAEDEASGITPEQAEAEWQALVANLNENRRLTGEEPLF